MIKFFQYLFFQPRDEGERHGVPDPGADGDGVPVVIIYWSKKLKSFTVVFDLLNCKQWPSFLELSSELLPLTSSGCRSRGSSRTS